MCVCDIGFKKVHKYMKGRLEISSYVISDRNAK